MKVTVASSIACMIMGCAPKATPAPAPKDETPIAFEFCHLTADQTYSCKVTARFETLELCHYWDVTGRLKWEDGQPTLSPDPAYAKGTYKTRCYKP